MIVQCVCVSRSGTCFAEEMEEPFDVAFDWLSKVVIYLRQEGTFDLVSKRVRQGILKKEKSFY